MNLRIAFLIMCCLCVYHLLYAQGLKIQGNDFFIDERSSYTVFENISPVFKEKLVLDFEIAPMNSYEKPSTGYILRIKSDDTNATYNILYSSQGENAIFKLNHEGRDVLISTSFDGEKLYTNQWIKIHLEFDLLKGFIILRINDEESHTWREELQAKGQWSPRIQFGRSEHVIDIPTFCLRNLKVSDAEKEYQFLLNENEGNVIHDSRKKIVGYVQNPVWLINNAYYWQTIGTAFTSGLVAGSNINTDTQDIYYFNEDSITFYNVRTKKIYSQKYINKCPLYLRLGTNFIDKQNKRLYVYEVSDLLGGDVTMVYLDLQTFAWEVVSKQTLPIQLHHHSCFFDEVNRQYIIFGGFGDLRYNENFYAFDLKTNTWDTLSFTGDQITPRYFTSLGYSKENDALYLFGGMGNESGDQTVGRVYYYELYKVDLKRRYIIKLWEIPWKKENVVPVRGMVLTDDNQSFYTLCYPEHFSKSALKLYRFSVKDGDYEILGDSIPIISEKITTNANLYYNKHTNELYSLVQEFDHNDTGSDLKIYSLSFPPVTMEGLSFYAEDKTMKYIGLLIFVVILAVIAGVYFFVKKRKTEVQTIPDYKTTDSVQNKQLIAQPIMDKEQNERPNALYLFGNFSIRDRNNKDISYMLSARLKQAFLLILRHSPKDDGISTQELSELLWPDKSEDKVKNSRGVTLNNLRKILNELDGIKLVHEKGLYKLIFDQNFYCDYARCLEIVEDKEIEKNMEELTSIIYRGKFLKSTGNQLFDPFKEHVERILEPVLLIGMEKSYNAGNYYITIALCEALFYIDPLNEEVLSYIVKALSKLRMNDEAKRQYLFFVAEYKNMTGNDYPKTFAKIKE